MKTSFKWGSLLLFLAIAVCILSTGLISKSDNLVTNISSMAVCVIPDVTPLTTANFSSFLSNLFDTTSYPARWNCGYWSDFEGWFYILSDFSIFTAYLSIPVILAFIFIKQGKIPFKRELVLFSAFILLCGFTHLIEVVIFWEPIYRFSALVKAITGVVSWVTVFALAQSLPIALTFKNPIELEKEIDQRKETEEQLQNSNSELDAFTYSVSHDLRAPLRAIDGYSTILKEEHTKGLDEEGKMYLERILANTSKMGNLIDDLLDFSRLTRTSISFEKFSSKELVKAIIDLSPEFQNVQVHWDTLPSITGDPSLIKQVLQNLIANAVKYSKNEESPQIIVSGMSNDQESSITVKDNGVGFDMKYEKKLFEVFQRLHADNEFEGNGIGLALSKKIIDRHNGRIEFDSKINSGSIFTVIIPKQLSV